jgi:hypothetical protein
VQNPFSADALVGQTVTRIARVLYEYKGEIDPVDGALELELDGHVVLFDGDADGERLRIRERAWEDPFKEPLSRENEEYVAEHGKWRLVDYSQQDPYTGFVGRPLTRVCLLENERGCVAGVRLAVASRSLWFVVEGDECHVYWDLPVGFSEAAG